MEPPRRRGKVACADQTIQPDGITPAWAGKRLSPVTPYNPPSDHPRMGGEKRSSVLQCCGMPGSPPRRRGKVIIFLHGQAGLRITPAWAGKRTRSWRAYGCPWDHPRIGGEKSNRCWLRCSALGSPPHGQGKVVCNHFAGIGDGITPAWAGKRPPIKLAGDVGSGSPPRGRGKGDDRCTGHL